MPRKIRLPIAVIYAFARTADDFADEGEATAAQRLELLNQFETQVLHLSTESSNNPIFIALKQVCADFKLHLPYLQQLMTAFKQDVEKTRYQNYVELMFYCQHSANPVGRLLLQLFQHHNEETCHYSDALCTALQLINFLQDLHQDFSEHGRIYIPLDEMRQFGVSSLHFDLQQSDESMLNLYRFQVRRAHQLLLKGVPLGKRLPGRAGFEIRLIIASALQIIQLLWHQPQVFSRPRLKSWMWLPILSRALRGNHKLSL